MPFRGTLGICIKCKEKKLIVAKSMCQECYMKEWNDRKDVRRRKELWEKENKWKRKIRRAQRLILIRTKEFVSINLLRDVFKRDKYTCQYCGSKRDLSIDHKIPIAKKINNSKENLIIACVTCNAFKSNMGVKEFKKKYFERIKLGTTL